MFALFCLWNGAAEERKEGEVVLVVPPRARFISLEARIEARAPHPAARRSRLGSTAPFLPIHPLPAVLVTCFIQSAHLQVAF